MAQALALRHEVSACGLKFCSFPALPARATWPDICTPVSLYFLALGAVPKRPKGEVCKTSIRGFKSHPRLQKTCRLPKTHFSERH